MTPEQTENSQGEVPERITQKKQVKEGAIFWLNSVTPKGEINYHERVKVVKGPYRLGNYPGEFVNLLELDTSIQREIPLPLIGLGIRARSNPDSRTSSWLEPYVEPKSP
jgi:hypothetical protein